MKHIKVELDFIPVEERLPEERVHVLCLTSTGRVCECFYVADLGRLIWFGAWYISEDDVTHWAEIPTVGR